MAIAAYFVNMGDEKLNGYLAYLDGRSPGGEHQAIKKMEELGVDIPNLLARRYKISRRWSDRALCISHCIEHSKTSDIAYELGILALQDRSRTVRRAACRLLTAAQKHEAIEQLEKLLADEASKDDAEAAISALTKQGSRNVRG